MSNNLLRSTTWTSPTATILQRDVRWTARRTRGSERVEPSPERQQPTSHTILTEFSVYWRLVRSGTTARQRDNAKTSDRRVARRIPERRLEPLATTKCRRRAQHLASRRIPRHRLQHTAARLLVHY